MTLTSLSPINLNTNHIRIHGIRLLLILFISLIIVHLLSQNQLPFTADYSFPLTAFGIIALFGFTICNLNWVVYHFIKLPGHVSYKKQLMNRILLQSASTLLFYCILYSLVIIIWFEQPFHMVHFLKYLLICLTIITLEFLVIELLYQSKIENNHLMQSDHIVIPAMTRDVNIPYGDIEMFSSSNGVITMHAEGHKPLITKYSSLDELEGELPSHLFFRVNRQYLVNRDVVHRISRNVNRTLHLDIKLKGTSLEEPIVISRYKRKDFLSWLKNQGDN